MSSVILVALNIPNHNNDADNNNADAKDAAGKKTLMRDATAAGTGGGGDNDIGGGPYDSALALSVAPALAMMTRRLGIIRPPLFTRGRRWRLGAIGDTLLVQRWRWQ